MNKENGMNAVLLEAWNAVGAYPSLNMSLAVLPRSVDSQALVGGFLTSSYFTDCSRLS